MVGFELQRAWGLCICMYVGCGVRIHCNLRNVGCGVCVSASMYLVACGCLWLCMVILCLCVVGSLGDGYGSSNEGPVCGGVSAEGVARID